MWLISFGFGKTRAKKCYITLLAWIIIVSFGLYWLLTGSANSVNSIWVDHEQLPRHEPIKPQGGEASKWLERTTISKKKLKSGNSESKYDTPLEYENSFVHSSIHRLCNPPEDIHFDDENLQVSDFKLDAMVVLFRHGDRGPLSHVGSRNLSAINCSSDHPDFHKFFRFATDTMAKLGGYMQFIGPFHSFQKVPTSGQCQLGQLSQQGSLQLIQLGKVFRARYQSTLFNSPVQSSPHIGKAIFTKVNSSHSPIPINFMQNVRVIAYSTRYRRTLQSLMAFLYGLLGPKFVVPNVTIRESQSINFCFNDCSCRANESLKKTAAKKHQPSNEEKRVMVNLVNQINAIIGTDKSKKSGTTLLDLLLVYPCHKTAFPCKVKNVVKDVETASKYEDCIKNSDLSSLIHLLEKETEIQKKIAANQQLYLLTSYGLLKEIVNLALKMTSSTHSHSYSQTLDSNILNNTPYTANSNGGGGRTKVAIFSGHDTTLQSLTGALGILSGHPDIHLVPYASRLIFEFYRKTNVPPNSARKHFFRVVYNGQAVTHLVRFCSEKHKIVVAKSSDYGDSNKMDNNISESETGSVEAKNVQNKGRHILCPLENLVRFLHDHYFESFSNSTNFKDACQKKTKKRKK